MVAPVVPENLSGRPLQRIGTRVEPDVALARVLETGNFDRISRSSIFDNDDPNAGGPVGILTLATADGANVGDGLRGCWEADLLLGAVAELTASQETVDLRDAVAGFADLQQPDGTVLTGECSGMGDVTAGQVTADGTDQELSDAARAALVEFGLEVEDVHVYRALLPAIAVVVTAPDVERTARDYDAIIESVFGRPSRFEGWYLEIRAPSGKVLVRSSLALRSGAGRGWVADGYAVDSGTMPAGILAEPENASSASGGP